MSPGEHTAVLHLRCCSMEPGGGALTGEASPPQVWLNRSRTNCRLITQASYWIHCNMCNWSSFPLLKPVTPLISVMKVFDLIIECEIAVVMVLLWDIIGVMGRGRGLVQFCWLPVQLIRSDWNISQAVPCVVHTLWNLTCVRTQCFLSPCTSCVPDEK